MSNGGRIFRTCVCCPLYRMTNVPSMHYLCTVHKSSSEHLCTNGWRIFWTSVCCPFVHKRLTDISERKGKENAMKIKKITQGKFIQSAQEKGQTLVRYVGQQTDSKRLSDILVHKRLRGQIYIRLLSEHRTSVCCPKHFVVKISASEDAYLRHVLHCIVLPIDHIQRHRNRNKNNIKRVIDE